MIKRIEKAGSKHLYGVETRQDGKRVEIHVEANNSAQAVRIAERAGYEVGSVNMIG